MFKFTREQRVARLTKHAAYPQYPEPTSGTDEAKIFSKGCINGGVKIAKEAFDIISTLRTEVYELESALRETDPNHPILKIIDERRDFEALNYDKNQ